MVSVLPCFWLGQCGSSRVYKRRRLSTVRSAQTDFVVQLGISLSLDFIDSSFSSSILSPFGFIRFSSEIFRASGSANAEVVFALYKKKRISDSELLDPRRLKM